MSEEQHKEKLTAGHIEALREKEALRERLTRLHNNHQLEFERRWTQEKHCANCDRMPSAMEIEVTDQHGERQKKTVPVPVSVITIQDVTLCEQCFDIEWLLSNHVPAVGPTHPSTPRSEQDYDGGNFHSGEW